MATKKKTDLPMESVEQSEPKFSKEQILGSKRFSGEVDVINAVWTDNSAKTINQVEEMIEKYMKGQVK